LDEEEGVQQSGNTSILPQNSMLRTATLLGNLMPYTEYMFYIATYTTAQAPTGAKSEITTYQTRPSSEYLTEVSTKFLMFSWSFT